MALENKNIPELYGAISYSSSSSPNDFVSDCIADKGLSWK